MPNCEWKGTTALTLTGLTFAGLSVMGVFLLTAAGQQQCESQLQALIDDIRNKTIDTPEFNQNITFPITIPALEINDYINTLIPSYTFNVTVPINIPALNLPIALFLGNSTIDSLEQLPKQLGSICADQMKMHASSWASIIIMFFLFIAVGYAFISSSQKQINQLADRLVDIGHQGQERLGFLHGHKKNYSV